jgi:WD40 repeat protein
VKFSPDGKLLATGGYGTRATLWLAATGKRLRDFDAGPEGGLTPIFSPDGTILAVGNRNAKTRLFDVATGRLRHELPWGVSQELKFDPAGKRLAIVYVDGSLAVWSIETGELLNRVRTRGEELYAVDWSPDGSMLVSAGRNAFVTLWNADDLTVLNEIECPEWVIAARFNPDGTRLIFAGGTALASPERYIETWAVP